MALNIYWTNLILRVIITVIRIGNSKDIREDDDDEEDDNVVNIPAHKKVQ